MSLRDTMTVRQSVRAALNRHDRVVLAVSGGVDSVVLLDAAASTLAHDRIIVATFDHGTGPTAANARSFVERLASELGIQAVGARAESTLSGEAAFRDARWRFLREVAAQHSAAICTAHSQDDQVETVAMRVLRDAGPRGLASLYADSTIVRPFLRLSRRQLVLYARAQGLAWIEDPSNATPAYLRNRVRHDLLPALRRVRPSIDDDLLSTARRAARWRRDVEAYCDGIAGLRILRDGRGADVPAAAFVDHPRAAASILWPAIAARVGVILDRRGIHRLSSFAADGRVGSCIQLSGGWQVVRSRNGFNLRSVENADPTLGRLVLSDGVQWGEWRFRAGRAEAQDCDRDAWSACLPHGLPLFVRQWEAGDAMLLRDEGSRRKIKHLLSAAGVTGHERAGWPVVLAGTDIVWVPGVRRADAATARSGRPGLPFTCEYINR